MKLSRRNFIKKGALTVAGISVIDKGFSNLQDNPSIVKPIVISTWRHGVPANQAAWEILSKGGYALDAVETGVRVPEGDPEVITVGYGGIPDTKGKVTLDACIMNEKNQAGSVTFLEHIKHPVSVARMVMEKTPHVILSGKGALKFALQNGFKKENLMTPKMKVEWKKWRKEKRVFSSKINIENQLEENHDTIGMISLDKSGRLCGACSTSGMAYKMHGRVGDSPIIGAGLFVDGEIGAATATGTGELVLKTLGSFLVVEFIRNGLNPAEACKQAVLRIIKKIPEYEQHQIGYIALDKNGHYGAFCIQPGFEYAVQSDSFTGVVEAESFLKKR